MKRLLLAAAFVAASFTYALAAGSITLSGSQQFDSQGRPLSGCKLYTYQASTTTPQSAYSDTSLTLALPNPMVCDASGRLPFFYLADGSIKIRLADSAGVTVVAADGLLVIGPSSGGGGGSPVDATTVLGTGDVKGKYGTGTLTGFVRLNARTIGSASSGATERANADAQSLFEYLWTADTSLAVSGGRGASANADWLANKTLTLPDFRGRTMAALDDMGNTAAGRLTSTYFGTSAIVLGAVGGAESQTLTSAQMPSHTHTGSGTSDSGGVDHTHGYLDKHANSTGGGANGFAVGNGDEARTTDGASAYLHTHTFSFTTAATGSGGAHPIVPPMVLLTFYIKL